MIDELHKQWKALQPLDRSLKKLIDQRFMIDFNYNSTNIEGKMLSYNQTKMLLLFGRTGGVAMMREYEEMKAHNVGLELVKSESSDKERKLTENFIRNLNRTILVEDSFKISQQPGYQYKIYTGVYKARPNPSISSSGYVFSYASPAETPAMMADLVDFYNKEEKLAHLSPIELAAIVHYRYTRIHPFEDGNDRIARLLVNYILQKHDYPMVVVPITDRDKYISILNECDANTGQTSFDGANAKLSEIKPLVDYIAHLVEQRLRLLISVANGETVFSDDDPIYN
jgi:Fic family protein